MKSSLVPLIAVNLILAAGSFAATINVGAPPASIQAAINSAGNGDVIQLQSGTYVEDLIIIGGANAKTNLTIEAAPGQTPVIEAANTAIPTPARGILGILSLFIEAVAGYPADQPDQHGFLIEGNGTTLRNLTIRNNSIDGDGQFHEATAVQIAANDVRIENCVIECDPATNAGRCIYVFTGNLQVFDQAVQALGAPKVFGPAGYTQPLLTSSNLQVVNTTLRYGEALFDTTDFATYLGLLLSGETLYIPPVPSSGSFTNVEFDGGNLASGSSGLATCDGGTYTFDNCFFHDHRGDFTIGGGNQTFNDCTWQRALRDDHVEFNGSPEEGNSPIVATFNNCLFCGGGDAGRLVRVNEGTGTFNACIFDVTSTDPNYRAIQYSPGDITQDYYIGVPGLDPPTQTSCILDNCDVYAPSSIGVLAEDGPDSHEPPGTLTITDSIFQAAVGVSLTADSPVALVANINNNDIFAGTQVSNTGSFTVNAASNLNVDPGYTAPGCDKDGFLYSNQALATAGTNGSALGSQGPIAPSAIIDWSLYQ
ncbi:MAG: hypothetical protein DIKNOCCD_02407 [bacterium]|nr:hypothetical protein [bacterium]MBV6482657.1 hypothetical protein [bacterium]